jgi:Protein of unknown function (DUF2799)
MERLFKSILPILILGILTSCATLSKNECLEANWFEIGRRDGATGKPRSLFQEHYKACLKYAVKGDREAYYRGREAGLGSYCTYETGYKQGSLNRAYRYVCPSNFEPNFLAGYAKGQEIYQYNKKIASLEKHRKSIEKQIKDLEKQMYSSHLSDEKRTQIRSDLKDLDIQYRDVVRELNYQERRRPSG